MPNCVQLHKKLQIGWEIFGPQITIQLSGQVCEYRRILFSLVRSIIEFILPFCSNLQRRPNTWHSDYPVRRIGVKWRART